MMMKSFILTFLLAFIIHLMSFGQKNDFQIGVKLFEEKKYESALTVFEKKFHNGDKSLEVYRYISESNFYLEKYEEACHWFSIMIRQHTGNVAPKYLLFYAQSLSKVNRKNESQFWFDKFEELKIQMDITKMHHFLLNTSFIHVTNFSSLNSLRSEFAPFRIKSDFVFVSNGKGKKRKWKKRKPKQGPFVDVFRLNLQDSLHEDIRLFSPAFVSRFNDGPVCFYSNGEKAILTMNDEQKKFSKHTNETPYNATKINMIKLYESTFDSESGEWTKPLLSNVNVDNSSSGHASVSPSGKYLLFASDRKQGEGKSDIYIAEYSDEEWKNVTNLGKSINTSDSEVFPFFLSDTTFVFSSDRKGGIGGLDLYLAVMDNSEVKVIRHLKEPINSEADDFAPFFIDEFSEGYISSNRRGGKGADDIYKVNYLPPDSILLHGMVYNTETGAALDDLTIYFEYENSKYFSVKSDQFGQFNIWLNTDKDYSVKVQNMNFAVYSDDINLKEFLNGENLYVPMKINTSVVSGTIYAQQSAMPLKDVKVTIESESVESEVGAALTDEKGRYKFNLQPNNKYIIKVYKKGYLATSKPLSTIGDFQTYNEHSLDFSLDEFETGHTIRFDNIKFSSESYEVLNSEYPEIEKMVSILKNNPQLKVEIGVHSDSRGDQFENLKKTYSQARSLVKLLINKGGINIGRIVAKGYGESKLLNDCNDNSVCSESEHQLNRRVEFKILEY